MSGFPAAVLVVLDGWGMAEAGPGNAISLARTPTFDALWARYPHTTLTACGRAVGLPEGQMGNSEVGHMNLGAGAIVMQDLTRIDVAVEAGELSENAVLRAAYEAAAGGGRRLHLIGLVSDGGVHSSDGHLRALVAMAAQLGVDDLVLHAFTDGRDTLPHSGAGFLEQVEEWMAHAGVGRVGSVIGRYFAMDRDRRWDRVERAWRLLVHGEGARRADTGAAAVRAAYDAGETDEFIAATVVGESDAVIQPGDPVIAFNFRPDRMREITQALADPEFDGFARGDAPVVASYTTMTQYAEEWTYPVAFPPRRPEVTLTSVIADHGRRQLHVAETEKYPHVTYFFGGGAETPAAGERREVVPSPRDVATYDLKPEMSAVPAADAFIAAWQEDSPSFGIINFANTDMVGHTGVIPAAVRAAEVVDAQLARIVETVQANGGVLFITADHGNSDHMLEPDGSPNTAHSLNPVPVIVTAEGIALREGGVLADVAPTLLALLNIAQPEAMTGRSLLA
ncbi:MAG TPA: 2,3-bisphosphoglycerate-independent phosphoglycerate mutase [Solirubrobacteraceae bacterium]|nr:2,3-bisphosphoglycerate-independent phosphoglycerate mutase [Solirubrobacteraceae bacterium]